MTQLQQAASRWNKDHPATPVDVHYRLKPYQLRAEHSEEPFDRNEYSIRQYGPERWTAASTNLRKAYTDVGLKLSPDASLSNTNTAHRLEQLALDTKGADVQFALGVDIMKAYQLHGVAPSDRPMLSRIAVQHGLFDNEQDATKWLDGNDKDAETKAGYAAARAEGVSGVPHFVFQNKYATSGAIGVDGFYSVIDQVMQRGGSMQ